MYKFGKGDAQQLQLLYANISLQQWGNAGGLPQGRLPGNPNALAYYPYDTLAQSYWIGIFGRYGLSPQQYASNVGLGPGVPDTNVAITQPQVALSLQTRLLKIQYDDRLGTNAYLARSVTSTGSSFSTSTTNTRSGRRPEALRATRRGRCKVDRRAA